MTKGQVLIMTKSGHTSQRVVAEHTDGPPEYPAHGTNWFGLRFTRIGDTDRWLDDLGRTWWAGPALPEVGQKRCKSPKRKNS